MRNRCGISFDFNEGTKFKKKMLQIVIAKLDQQKVKNLYLPTACLAFNTPFINFFVCTSSFSTPSEVNVGHIGLLKKLNW